MGKFDKPQPPSGKHAVKAVPGLTEPLPFRESHKESIQRGEADLRQKSEADSAMRDALAARAMKYTESLLDQLNEKGELSPALTSAEARQDLLEDVRAIFTRGARDEDRKIFTRMNDASVSPPARAEAHDMVIKILEEYIAKHSKPGFKYEYGVDR